MKKLTPQQLILHYSSVLGPENLLEVIQDHMKTSSTNENTTKRIENFRRTKIKRVK